MLQILSLTNGNIIATKADSQLSQQDMEKIHPIVHNILDNNQRVRWYFEIEDSDGWASQGLWLNSNIDIQHAADYEKISIVVNRKWQEWIVPFLKPFCNAEIRYYDYDNQTLAKEWIHH